MWPPPPPTSWPPPPPPPAPPPAPPPSSWPPPPPAAPAGSPFPGPVPELPLNRQLDAGGAPDSPSSAWMWLLFAVLGFVGGQIVAAIFVAVTAAVDGKLGSLAAIARLDEPPTWYIVSTLLGLWAGFFGAAWLATGVKGTKSFSRDLGPAIPVDRPRGCAHRGGRADPGGPHVHPHRPARAQLQPALQRPVPEAHGRVPRRRVCGDRRHDGSGGALLRGAVLPGRPPAGAGPAVRQHRPVRRAGAWPSR